MMHIALFDFDGTITTEDTFPAFTRRSVKGSRLKVVRAMLAPFTMLRTIGLMSVCSHRKLEVRLAMSGRSANNMWYNGERFAQNYLTRCLSPQAMERIKWHKERGDRVVVVSEGLNVYLRSWCDTHGVELICNVLEERNSKMTGRVVGGFMCRSEKAARVKQSIDLTQYGKVYAYGDSSNDLDMLKLAGEAFYRWRPMTGTA